MSQPDPTVTSAPTPVSPTPVRLGVDTGGTFTDLVRLDVRGLFVHKLRSTPGDPARAILAGIQALAPLEQHPEITHGSTVATNALLERKGARVALLATAGFEDVLLIGRQTRRELYNFLVEAPRPLVEPALTFGVHERLAYDGSVLEPLTPEEITRLLDLLQAAKPDAVAVCLLHSYANSVHERRLTEALTAAGFLVSASHAILPEYREFERWSTTTVNAYVTPLMAAYLSRLEQGLAYPASATAANSEAATEAAPATEAATATSPAPATATATSPATATASASEAAPSTAPPTPSAPPLRIMQSNGGSISATTAKQAAVQTILSGPAAGVVGAQAVAAASGFHRIITFDMGGTSTDVSLIDHHIATTGDSTVGDLPVRLPVLDIHTVGAGGGSIAFLDSGGALRVGPRSAGANPGPACYGTGLHLTVTDANLLLGRLDPTFFLGGRMALDLPRTQAIAQTLAAQLHLSVLALAEGIVRIANANMERAIRVVSVQRGHDPRDFALLAFGGAGGLHACALAESLDIPTVLIPEHSGVLSALGMLLADVTKDYSAAILRPTPTLPEAVLHARLEPLLAQAQTDLRLEGFSLADILLSPSLDMRYQGQAFEIPVPFTPDFATAFHRLHHKLYGYANPARPTEVVQLRLKAIGRTDKPLLTQPSSTPTHPSPDPLAPLDHLDPPTPQAIRETIFHAQPHPTPIFHRDHLTPGMAAAGPAILLTGQSTNIIPPLWHWSLDPTGTLLATHPSGQPA